MKDTDGYIEEINRLNNKIAAMEEDIVNLTKNGADCIITDYPRMAYEAVQSCR